MRLFLIWAVVFSVGLFLSGSSLALFPMHEEGPVIRDAKVVEWTFDMRSNHSERETWAIHFDDFFPNYEDRYYVYARISASSDCDGEGVHGAYYMIQHFYLNDMWVAGVNASVIMEGYCSAHWLGYDGPEEQFLNATPKSSGNVFLAEVHFWTELTQPGSGNLTVEVGPLELHSRRSTTARAYWSFLAMTLLSGVLAVPASYVILRISDRRQEHHAGGGMWQTPEGR